jgi:hypothetical protein
MKKAVFGLAKNKEQAQRILTHLQNEGFSFDHISFLAYDQEKRFTKVNARGELEVDHDFFEEANENEVVAAGRKNYVEVEKHSKASEGAVTGAVAGGVIGGSLGLLAGIGALAIPGFGALIAAGPIMAALTGTGLLGSVGLLLGGLIGLGIPEYEAKRIEKSLKEGSILINIETQDPKEITKAEEVLKQEGATDISSVVMNR